MGFCAKSPCMNNGTCFNVQNDYECKCPDEYDGRHCENMKDHCKDSDTNCQGKLLNYSNWYKNESPVGYVRNQKIAKKNPNFAEF